MELKDVILSTLAEIEELSIPSESAEQVAVVREEKFISKEEPLTHKEPLIESVQTVIETVHAVRDDEARMLEGIRERLLVLFEGFQSPNNTQIEAKVDLTLNFFEYLLATIDNRLETIKES
ncbi:MAG: hypothetical protein Q8M43_03660 [Sulfuricurvum sp.]|uniref:CiaD-like domain-containing protein n=1 Tax=Sulfuricurvum sp. TaxID=2025608 RepID=UPI0027334CF5|nr:hypothetical protein [Sulfuricurvum sp.]MDP2851370.1 hypothetical protein [Sulfuricurvum sp.]MDP3291106.1 hypothetical protein [Sulfuricurvum sp.]